MLPLSISWAICKCALSTRQITMPAPHHSIFYRLDNLPATQPTASNHYNIILKHINNDLSTALVNIIIVQCVLPHLVMANCIQTVSFQKRHATHIACRHPLCQLKYVQHQCMSHHYPNPLQSGSDSIVSQR